MGKLFAGVLALGLLAGCGEGFSATCTPKPTRQDYLITHYGINPGPFKAVFSEPKESDIDSHSGEGCAEDDPPLSAEGEAEQAAYAANPRPVSP
jgi:hypothetical protein